MAALLREFADDRYGVRNRHRNLNYRNARVADRLNRAIGMIDAGRPHHGDNANFGDSLDYLVDARIPRGHRLLLSIHHSCQRSMRAVREVITCSTSDSVAIVVSPGVVIARAPCAAPHSTDHCASLP